MPSDLDRKRTKLQERRMNLAVRALDREHRFMDAYSRARDLVPEDWHLHEYNAPMTPHRTKITIRLDADLVKWFRHIGFGYQERMNTVLRAYMNAVLAKYVESEGDRGVDGKPL